MPQSADWFARNIPCWETLTADLKDHPIRALEIGSFEGRSARWMVDHLLTHPKARLDCVDTWEGSPEHWGALKDGLYNRFRENLADAIESGKITMHRGLSQNMLPKLHTPEPVQDLMQIDGSHTSRDTLSDAVMCFPLLKEGGLLIFDDQEWQGFAHPLKNPRTGIDAFLTVYAGCYEIVSKGYQVAIRKTNDAWLQQP